MTGVVVSKLSMSDSRSPAAGVVLWLSKLCMYIYIQMTGVVVSNYLWRTLGVYAHAAPRQPQQLSDYTLMYVL